MKRGPRRVAADLVVEAEEAAALAGAEEVAEAVAETVVVVAADAAAVAEASANTKFLAANLRE